MTSRPDELAEPVEPASPEIEPVAPVSRNPWWPKALIALGALIVIASVALYGTLRAGVHEINKVVPQASLLGTVAATPFSGTAIDGPLNLLIVGVDASGVRTDSIIIAHIPAGHDRVYLISLPRDTKVNLLTGGTNKINSTFDGGFANLAATIKLNYGITFNGGLTVNFDGFKDIVTKLGGVDMYVDETTYSIHHGYVGNDKNDHAAPYNINPETGVPICYDRHYSFSSNPDKCTLPGIHEVVYPKGNYHFDAYDALDFVRCRDGLIGTDYGRQRHQQQFIKALMQEAYAKGLADPTRLLGFISAMSKAFNFDGNGIAPSDWIFTLKAISPSSVVTIRTNDGQDLEPPGPSDGHGSEQALSDDTLALLAAVRTDRGSSDPVQQFLQTHPTWIAA